MKTELGQRIIKSNKYIDKLFIFNIDNLNIRMDWGMNGDGDFDHESGVGITASLKFPSHQRIHINA